MISFLAGFAGTIALGWFAFPRVLYQRVAQPVQFSHRTHTGDKVGLKCEDCHSLREDGTFTGIPKTEQCAGCHAAPAGNSAEEKRMIKEYIEPNREIPWLVYARQPENVYFSHVFHVKRAKIGCKRCHGAHGQTDTLRPFERNRVSGYSRDIWGKSISRIALKPGEGMKMDDCSKCHAERGVSNSCLACHK